MKIIEITERNSAWIEKLLDIWETSVKATHSFLSGGEIEAIKQYVPQALKEIPHLVVAEDETGEPVGFMGSCGSNARNAVCFCQRKGKRNRKTAVGAWNGQVFSKKVGCQ